MRSETPVLELAMAVAEPGADLALGVPLSLRLLPGECALIGAVDATRRAIFADLCSGLLEPVSGRVRFLGRDWRDLPPEYAAALRGRIGRVFTTGGWISFLDVATNILLPALHHTTRDRYELRGEAVALAHEFGLPGLPLDRPEDIAPADLSRAALVRAFLGEPLLVLVEDRPNLSLSRSAAVLSRLAAVCDRGGAVVWLAGEPTAADPALFPAAHHLRLSDQGLALVRRAA
jgi:phospholipid/cholesterol/gamma-HCH transport system ATP-binding protein